MFSFGFYDSVTRSSECLFSQCCSLLISASPLLISTSVAFAKEKDSVNSDTLRTPTQFEGENERPSQFCPFFHSNSLLSRCIAPQHPLSRNDALPVPPVVLPQRHCAPLFPLDLISSPSSHCTGTRLFWRRSWIIRSYFIYW